MKKEKECKIYVGTLKCLVNELEYNLLYKLHLIKNKNNYRTKYSIIKQISINRDKFLISLFHLQDLKVQSLYSSAQKNHAKFTQ